MSVFEHYSKYYDLLYKDKDYKLEAKYISELIKKYKIDAKSIFEMGCGTGKHAIQLAEYGYRLLGIDLSKEMLKSAKQIVDRHKLDNIIAVEHGDVRTYRTDDRFDICLSLFHVISYQITNSDLISAFKTAAYHLEPGGIFIFDCWYGPAVLTDRPTIRVKKLKDDDVEIIRIAEPMMHADRNIVDVNYEIFIREIDTNLCKTIKETHRMRYLFTPEIKMAFERTGFSLLENFEFMTDRPLDYSTWNGCYVGRKI